MVGIGNEWKKVIRKKKTWIMNRGAGVMDDKEWDKDAFLIMEIILLKW